MAKREIATIFTIGTLLLMAMVIPGIAVMQDPTIPPPPTPTIRIITPVPHGGSSYTTPTITYPRYLVVFDNDGMAVGNITQSSATDISFRVDENLTVDGQEVLVTIDGMLNSMPGEAKLKIEVETPDNSSLPPGLGLTNVLAQVNLTGFTSGWNVKAGSLNVTVKIPEAMVGNADVAKSLVLRYDGETYEILYPGSVSIDDGYLTVTIAVPHEQFSYGGYSKYMIVTGVNIPSPTPTAVPSASPTAEASPRPSVATGVLAVLLAAVVASGFILYFTKRRRP